jgi:hypothetical protein
MAPVSRIGVSGWLRNFCVGGNEHGEIEDNLALIDGGGNISKNRIELHLAGVIRTKEGVLRNCSGSFWQDLYVA